MAMMPMSIPVLEKAVRTAIGLGTGVVVGGTVATLRVTAVAANELAGWYERQVVDLLGIKVEHLSPATAPISSRASGEHGSPQANERLDEAMGRLLDRANSQTTGASRRELFAQMIDRIVPDEARIISALSDGSSSPLIHVFRRSTSRHGSVAVLENMSLVGRSANLALPHLTPTYVGHLLAMGLLEIGAEEPSMKTEYEILAADMAVLAAIKNASRGAISARVERHTIRLSLLGRELWAAIVGDAG